MKTSRSFSVLFGLLALLVSAPARADYPIVSTITVAGSGGGADTANAIAQDNSGNIYVAGSLTLAGGADIWVAKYSPTLVLLSSYTYDLAGFSDAAYGVCVDTPSGNVFVAGNVSSSALASSSDIWLAKFDSSLVLQTSATVNGSANGIDAANAIRISSGQLYVVGQSSVMGGKGQWAARYDTNLVLLSSMTYVQYDSYGKDILPVAGGDVFVAGSRAPNIVTSVDAWIGKFSSTWVLLASATINGPSSNNDEFERLVEDGSGGVYAVGYLNTATAGDRFIQRYDSNLVRVSSSLVNGPGNLDEYLTDILVTSSGTLLVAGEQSQVAGIGGRNALIAEYSSGLVLLSSTSYTTSGSFADHAYALLIGANQDVYAAGWVGGANQDAWIARYSTSPAVVASSPTAPSGFNGTAQSTSAILWSWVDNSSVETGFRVMFGGTNVSADLAANTTTWLQSGLGVNTSSGALFAQAFNSTGTANSGSVTRYSLAAAPTGLGSGGVTSSSATITWSGSATSYQLERSTGGSYTTLSTSAASPYGNTGLAAASTYYYRVLGLNGDLIATAYTSTITVVTLPAASSPTAPSGFTGTAQSTGSILWSWTDNSSDETGFRVMFGTSNVSGNLAANTTIWTQSGLAVNTSSGALFAQAFNSTGTADSGSLTRYSLAAVSTGLAASSVFQTSATITWVAGNPAGTTFELERSTGGAFALVVTSTVAAYADLGLSVASTYYYRVRSLNGDAVATAYASSITVITQYPLIPVAPTGFAGVAQSTSSILWSWTDNSTSETGFRVMAGTSSVSGNLAANATTWTQSGLAVNTSSGALFAQAFNSSGTANSGLLTRYSLAVVPGAPAASGVYQTSATLSWNAGGNPAGTTFQLERSTGTGFGLQFVGTATTYFDAFLTPGASHYYQVRALNGDSVATAYSSSVSVLAVPPPAIPGSAGTPVGTALGTSSTTWSWVLASGATNYYLYRPSDISYLGSSSSGPFVLTALSPNTAYGLRVAGVNVGGTGALSPSATVYTLAALPTGAAASSITATSLVVSWALAGNPGTTSAQLERSTSGVVYSTLTYAAVTSYADANLLGCTTYYYRVRNYNGDALPTAYASFQGVTANTTPSPPSGLTASANAGGTVGLSWNLSPTEGVTGYKLYWDAGTGNVSYGAPLVALGSTTASYTTGVLASSSTYTFALRTTHRCGVEESTGALAMSGAAVAAATVRAAIKEPDSGKRIAGNRVTILGELIAGTPGEVQQVLFQYKLAASTAWIDVDEANVNHTNPDFSFPYFVHADVTGLAAGSYDLRAVAYDRSGVPDAAPPAVRVVVDPVNYDINENDDNGKVKKNQTISNSVTSVVDTCGAGANDPAVRVTIPPGTVNTTTATVSVTANPTITTAAPAGQSFVGSAIKIDLSNGQTTLNGTAEITLTYPSTVLFPSLLQIYYLNEATGQWSRDFNSVVNTASRTITGLTPHFSTFAILLGTAFAANLDSLQVYPVPFKPNGPNADEGRPFTTSDANSGIIFANLAMGSDIKIYTLTGRLVARLDNPSIAGTVRWDARNQDGRDVASGAYFAVVTAAGQKAVVKKLVIIR